MKKSFWIIVLWGLYLSITQAAVLELSPAQWVFPANCPVSLDVMLDTESQSTLNGQFMIPFSDDYEIVGIIPSLEVYDQSLWQRNGNEYVYYGATNLRRPPFKWKGKIATVVIKSKPDVTNTSITFFTRWIWPEFVSDTSINMEEWRNILTEIKGANLLFDSTLVCPPQDIQWFSSTDPFEIEKKLLENIKQIQSANTPLEIWQNLYNLFKEYADKWYNILIVLLFLYFLSIIKDLIIWLRWKK